MIPMPAKVPPKSLPEALLKEPPSVKLLYLWLCPQGEVSYSQRTMARALGLTQANVSIALNRLRDLGLIEDSGDVRARVGARFRALVKPDGNQP